MEYKGMSLKEACQLVVYEKLVKIGGEGGLIALDKSGNIELPFNSEGMFRGSIDKEGQMRIDIYR
jgi:beta-aspartyl-peptidase (threonine type)